MTRFTGKATEHPSFRTTGLLAAGIAAATLTFVSSAHAGNTITFGANNNKCGGTVMCSTDGTTGYLNDGSGQAFNLSTINQWFQIDTDGNSHLSGQSAEPDKGSGGFLVLNDTGSPVTSFSLTISDDFTSTTPSVHGCTGAQTGNICDNFSAHGGSGSYNFNTELSGTDWDHCTQGTTNGQSCTGQAGGVAADFAPDMVTYTWTAAQGKSISAGSYFVVSFSGWNNVAAAKGWSIVASEPQPLDAAMAGEINGIIYVAGGYNPSGPSAALQAYNPATNTWAALASMPTALFFGIAGVINGQLYIAGGQNSLYNANGTDTLYVYDPPSNTWSQKANMPQPGAEGTGGVINSKFYVQSACSNGNCDTMAFDVYDPTTNTWTALANSPNLSTNNGSSAVINGKLYTETDASASASITQAYDPVGNTWTQLASIPTNVGAAAGVALDNKFWVFGGGPLSGGCQTTLVQVYDPTLDQWTTYSPSMPIGLAYESAEVVNGNAYVQGSSNGGGCNGSSGNNLKLVP
jgi:N-acetylneuraminic acid mutarotase